MIVAADSKPLLSEFKALMSSVDAFLNREAKTSKAIKSSKGAQSLEPIVKDAAAECAKGTPFEGKIDLWSGAHFPDIVAAKYYGIEVKSTIKDQWTSIGSSILESTRIADVERIYLTFGKLGEPIEFLSRPYEACLSDIAVTHYPRYKIDMQLRAGETIFDKMGIDYDTLRAMKDPVTPVADYYKKQLKPGESLWWANNKVDTVAPMTIRLMSSLSADEKRVYEAKGYVFFTECILSTSNTKYARFAFWLTTQEGIIYTSIRDSFSAGGRVRMVDDNGHYYNMPQIFQKIRERAGLMKDILNNTPTEELRDYWGVPIRANRAQQWIDLVIREEYDLNRREIAKGVLTKIFQDNGLI